MLRVDSLFEDLLMFVRGIYRHVPPVIVWEGGTADDGTKMDGTK